MENNIGKIIIYLYYLVSNCFIFAIDSTAYNLLLGNLLIFYFQKIESKIRFR